MDALGQRHGLDLAREGDRFVAREAIAATLAPWFAARPYAEVAAALTSHRVAWGPYRTLREALADDPDCAPGRGLFEAVQSHGQAAYPAPHIPLGFGAAARVPVRPAPRLGEHTDEILLELAGVSEAELGRLHDAGIVAGPDGR